MVNFCVLNQANQSICSHKSGSLTPLKRQISGLSTSQIPAAIQRDPINDLIAMQISRHQLVSVVNNAVI